MLVVEINEAAWAAVLHIGVSHVFDGSRTKSLTWKKPRECPFWRLLQFIDVSQGAFSRFRLMTLAGA